MTEQEKYEAVWNHPAYRVMSPGDRAAEIFLRWADPKKGETLRDLGCGSGKAGQTLSDYGLDVTLYDFAENAVDDDIKLPFVQHDLTKPVDGEIADYGYCCDVLEHIPTEDVPKVLKNVVAAGHRVFLQICCIDDMAGPLFGMGHLHLTIRPFAWWKEQLEALKCEILKSEDCETHCAFLVSAYASAMDFDKVTVMNVSHSTVLDNVKANLAGGYEEVRPYAVQDIPLMLLAGGPTLNDFEDEIISRRKAGEMIVTMNGTHKWCADRGITSSMHIMCDAREFNKRFVENPFPQCRYLIASQCHPSVASSLPKDQVQLWHAGESIKDVIEEWDREHETPREWFPIAGGVTVMLRAIPLLMMLGFRQFETFGFDCCLREGAHHAYSQPENDKKMELSVKVGGRVFMCHPWMVSQAGDFIRIMKFIGNHIDLCVRGDSLISHIITTAAEED